jgi:hypothetical protein
MRAAGPTPTLGLPLIQIAIAGGQQAEVERDLLARTVTIIEIEIAVKSAIANPRGYLPLPPVKRTTRVAVKMRIGKCSSNSIERAEELRLSYQSYWREQRSGNPRAVAAEKRLRLALLALADEATEAVSDDHLPWGRKMWIELRTRVQTLPVIHDFPDVDTDLLLGGICALANECKVWFSEDFDMKSAQSQLEEPHT